MNKKLTLTAALVILFTAGTSLAAERIKPLTTYCYRENPEYCTEKTVITFHDSGYISSLESYVRRKDGILLVERLQIRETPKGFLILKTKEEGDGSITLGEIHLLSSLAAKAKLPESGGIGEIRVVVQENLMQYEIVFGDGPADSLSVSRGTCSISLQPRGWENRKFKSPEISGVYSFNKGEYSFSTLSFRSPILDFAGISLYGESFCLYQRTENSTEVFVIKGERVSPPPLAGAVNFFILTRFVDRRPFIYLPFVIPVLEAPGI